MASVITLDGFEPCLQAVNDILVTAQYKIFLQTTDLQKRLFGHSDFIKLIQKFALTRRHGKLCVIVNDPKKAVSNHHPLIPLSQKLSSKIQLRVPNKAFKDYYNCCLIIDEKTLYYQADASKHQATLSHGRSPQCRTLLEEFGERWENSEESQELRRLMI